MAEEFEFSLKNIDSDLKEMALRGVTEFSLHDAAISHDKAALKAFLRAAQKYIPDVQISIPVSAALIDGDVVEACQNLFCSLDIFFYPDSGGGKYFFDKKLFLKKAALLNNAGLVFGFLADFARSPSDSIKNFRERIDFALPLYPNHIEFPQLYSTEKEAKKSATFSSQDITYARDVSFALSVFYSEGRAVPWFNSVLKPLRIAPSKFFSDFAEWQRCNNCGFDAREKIGRLSSAEIEKMQLLFLEEKYCEKKIEHLMPIVQDIVRINWAFSRLDGDGIESELNLSFNPDDLTSPAALDIESFSENVCMEECRIKVYAGREFPEYKFIQ